MTSAERFYVALLRLYPAEFRGAYAGELLASFRAHGDEARYRGMAGGARLWWFVGLDLLRSVPRAHLDAARRRFHATRSRADSGRTAAVFPLLWQDVRHGVRGFLRAPGFTLACIITLALGIGATTTIFSIVDAVLLRALPYPDAERLVQVGMRFGTVTVGASAPPDFFDIRESARSFEALAGSRMQSLELAGEGEPERFDAAGVTASYFDVLRVRPVLGRAFQARDDRPGGEAVIVLAHGLWQRRFGGDPAILGRTVTLSGRSWTVVGVMPERFRPPSAIYHDGVELWFPLGQVEDDLTSRDQVFLQVIGRLSTGATVAGAAAELSSIARSLDEAYPSDDPRAYWVRDLYTLTVGDVGRRLYVLLGAVAFLLLIACANVANLYLVRSTERSTEIAVRAALGAGRRRLATQLLAESALLGLAGGALGVLLAWAGLRAFQTLSPGDVPRLAEASIDLRVLAFAAAAALGTGLSFGVAPALAGARISLVGALREGGRGTTGGRGRAGFRGGLVIGQIAIALVLLVGAGLLINSFVRLTRVDAGFDPRAVVWLQVTLPERYETAEARLLFFEGLHERLAALPGAVATGAIHGFPLDGNQSIITAEPEGGRAVEGGVPRVQHHSITPGYFSTLAIPLAAGSDFAPSARANAPRVVIVSESFARRFWPGESAVGKRVRVGAPADPWSTVVGVAADVRHYGLAQDVEPMLYRPLAQFGRGNVTFAIRHDGRDPAAILRAARAAVWSLDGGIPLDRFGTLASHVRASLVGPRFYTVLLAGFAAVALALAFVGLYGTLAYTVRTRAREIGIRLALGAARHDVHRLIIGQGMILAAIGIALGAAGAFAAARVLRAFVYGVTPTDPFTFAAVMAGMALVAFGACWLPSRRAAGTDPARTLRAE